jgi:hypothetical protein
MNKKKIPNINFDAFEFEEEGCSKPGCPIPKRPRPNANCICNKPLMIYIPPGSHIHINCPVHGDKVIFGPDYTYCRTKSWKYEGILPKVTWK